MSFINSPFEQFKVFDLIILNYNFVLTNSLFQYIIVFTWMITLSFYLLSSRKKMYELAMFSYVLKEIYLFVYNTVFSYVGKKAGTFFPYIFFIFLFIFLFNAIGLIPYSFTITSHLAVTFGLGFMTWFGVLLIGFREWGIKYFALFCPHGASVPLLFFLPMIEFLSTTFRVFSLSFRLLANMVAGHILLDCILYFTFKFVFLSIAGTSISLINFINIAIGILLLMVLLLFEMAVAVLQAYIFIILSCIYLKEVL